MITLAPDAWARMVEHAEAAYPNECCGAMLGTMIDGSKKVIEAIPLANAFNGEQNARYELRPADLLEADRAARSRKLDLVGIYHSHPDAAAYFSETDLKNSCPWYSFVVLSVPQGRVHDARSFLPDADQSRADEEELICPKS